MLNDQLIDKRIVERNIKKGRVDGAEYRRMLGALPDLTAKVWREEASAPAAAPAAPPPAASEPEPARSGWTDDNVQPVSLG
jgi:hypothetical protein